DGGGANAALGPIEQAEPAKGLMIGRALSGASAASSQEGPDARDELQRVERLDDVVVGAGPETLDSLPDVRLGGEHDDRDAGPGSLPLPDAMGRRIPVELGHGDAHQDQLRLAGAGQ